MLKFFVALVLFACPSLSWAIAPYIQAESLQPAATAEVAEKVSGQLDAAGFLVLGSYFPKQLPDAGVVVVADEDILDDIRKLGATSIVGAGIRVGVTSDGTVSYMNPDYWYRAYFRGQFANVENSVRRVQEKLVRALGAGAGFGGEVAAAELPIYRYALGMERFDSAKNRLAEHVSFDEAVRTIRQNLEKGVGQTAKVYEIVMPEEKLAVFGVAMHDEARGDAVWMAGLGAQRSIAALPYELYVVEHGLCLVRPLPHRALISRLQDDAVHAHRVYAGGDPGNPGCGGGCQGQRLTAECAEFAE
jgi:hypothetical protein